MSEIGEKGEGESKRETDTDIWFITKATYPHTKGRVGGDVCLLDFKVLSTTQGHLSS